MYNGTDDRLFRASDMEPLMRPNSLTGSAVDAGSSALMSDLLRLCPKNLGPSPPIRAAYPRLRNLVTTLSMDLGTPALSPNWWSGMPVASYLAANTNGAQFAPSGQAVLFPTLPPNQTIVNPAGTSPPTSEFGTDWRALTANVTTYTANNLFPYTSPGGRIQLNRPLPPYPHMGSGLVPPYTAGAMAGASTGYNLTAGNPIYNQFLAAQNARQALANDIYRRLLALAGIPVPGTAGITGPGTPTNPTGTPINPSAADLAPRRWLAQLAVNIVDFIDEDDISTPFNFYTTQDTNGAAITTPAPQMNGSDEATNTGANPMFWVFGTELPKVVLNEALAEAQNSTPALAPVAGEQVNVWVELYNSMQTPPTAPTWPSNKTALPSRYT